MAENLETSEMRRRDFIANVSHELKTPMTTITGFADGLLDGTIPKEEENKYLEMISSEAKRLSRLVRGMLDASRVQEVDRADILSKSFNIVETASIALLSLEKKINDKGLDVEVNMPEEPLMVRGDSDTITQVIYNLLDNAAKFARAARLSESRFGRRRARYTCRLKMKVTPYRPTKLQAYLSDSIKRISLEARIKTEWVWVFTLSKPYWTDMVRIFL